jgi:hypothetical protein
MKKGQEMPQAEVQRNCRHPPEQPYRVEVYFSLMTPESNLALEKDIS